MDIHVNEIVRLYHPDESFEDGRVVKSTANYVEVDFDNWVERFKPTDFGMVTMDYGRHVRLEDGDIIVFDEMIATGRRGIIIDDYTRGLKIDDRP